MRYNKAITQNQLKQVYEPANTGLSWSVLVLLLVIIIVNYVFATAS